MSAHVPQCYWKKKCFLNYLKLLFLFHTKFHNFCEYFSLSIALHWLIYPFMNKWTLLLERFYRMFYELSSPPHMILYSRFPWLFMIIYTFIYTWYQTSLTTGKSSLYSTTLFSFSFLTKHSSASNFLHLLFLCMEYFSQIFRLDCFLTFLMFSDQILPL